MAEEEIDEDLGASEGQKSSKIVSLLLFINILVSGAALFKIMGLPSEPVIVNTIAAGDAEGDAEDEGEPELPGPIHAFDPFLVNLNEAGGGRFLRVTVELELKDEAALADVLASERKVKDELLRFLSNLRVEETLGETNRLRIRDGIISRINILLDDENLIAGVYFPDFVVQ
jgi:flagellar FliL protein